MQRKPVSEKFFSPPDLLILLLLGALIYAIVVVGREYRADFHPVTQIDLSLWSLPRYTLFSAARGFLAYLISLAFSLCVGYAAAKSRQAERILIPLLDIGQSIPVLGFLPGLIVALIALFPRNNIGLELTAIIMIFTSQTWNMTFSFYSSLKSIPPDIADASTLMGLSPYQRLMKLELPFAAVPLAWNSLMSMAGGWFFLTVCEAFKLGDREYRLPGIGSYMAVAISEGDNRAMLFGVIAMMLLIVIMDFLIWRPILSWVRRFRSEEVEGGAVPEPLINLALRESKILGWLKVEVRRFVFRNLPGSAAADTPLEPEWKWTPVAKLRATWDELSNPRRSPRLWKGVQAVIVIVGIGVTLWGTERLAELLWQVSSTSWVVIFRNTMWSFLRIVIAVALSTLWTVPVAVWIGTSARRTRIAQPIVQILASFPAPMLYPLALGLLLWLGISFQWGSLFLIMLGVQWYMLFNVLAGSLSIPQELRYAMDLMETPRWGRWKTLYLPSVFPSLVSGWVVATGGAWNATIVAEYVSYKGNVFLATGLGSTIVAATDSANIPMLAASLTVMVTVVIGINRTVWARAYEIAQTRFRLDT